MMEARGGLFLPLSPAALSAVLELAQRQGFTPDGAGVARLLVRDARKQPAPLQRVAGAAVDFIRTNPQMVATAANVARAFLKR